MCLKAGNRWINDFLVGIRFVFAGETIMKDLLLAIPLTGFLSCVASPLAAVVLQDETKDTVASQPVEALLTNQRRENHLCRKDDVIRIHLQQPPSEHTTLRR